MIATSQNVFAHPGGGGFDSIINSHCFAEKSVRLKTLATQNAPLEQICDSPEKTIQPSHGLSGFLPLLGPQQRSVIFILGLVSNGPLSLPAVWSDRKGISLGALHQGALQIGWLHHASD